MSAEVESIKMYEGDDIALRDDQGRFVVTVCSCNGQLIIKASPKRVGLAYTVKTAGGSTRFSSIGAVSITLTSTSS